MQISETYNEKLTSIRSEFNTPIHANKVLLLVEGADDKKFFANLCNTQTVVIYFMEGKFFVEQALNDLNTLLSNIIGICDADFLHLENKPSPLPNLFLTDAHDLELMMLSADNVFEKLGNEYNIEATFNAKMLSIVSFLAYFRWYNEKNVWYNEDNQKIGFTFTDLHLNKLYKNNQLDKQDLVKQVKAQSKQAPKTSIDEIISAVEALQNTTHNLLQLCNGHDCIKILAAHITQSNIGKKGVNDKDVEQSVRFAYHITDYKQTNLYKNTQAWATNNHCILYKI